MQPFFSGTVLGHFFFCQCPLGVLRQNWNNASSFPSAWERVIFLELPSPALKEGVVLPQLA